MLPSFIGIGAQRSGTSWLFNSMSQHPEVWLPIVKEIHYFDKQYPPLEIILNQEKRPKGVGAFLRIRKIRNIAGSVRRACLSEPLFNIPWLAHYYFVARSDDWYEALFKNKSELICGDITPAYSTLDIEAIKHIHELMPNAKIIYLLRNPIERAWSQALLKLTRFTGRSPDSLSTQEILDVFQLSSAKLRSNYIRTLNNWEAVYPKNQIFIGFFDDLVENPTSLLKNVYNFIGASSNEKFLPKAVTKKVGAGPKKRINQEIYSHLAEMHLDNLRQLSERFGGHASKWLAEAESSL